MRVCGLTSYIDNFIKGFVARGGIRRIYVADDPTSLPMGFRRVHSRTPWLILCFRGTRDCRVFQDGMPRNIALRPGEALFVHTGSWIVAPRIRPFWSFTMAVHESWVRGCISRCSETLEVLPTQYRNYGRHDESRRVDADDEIFTLMDFMLGTRDPAYLCRLADASMLRFRQLHNDAGAEGRSSFLHAAACRYVLEHFSRPLTREDVARRLNIHPSHLTRIFHEVGGQNFSRFLQETRVECAKSLLANPTLRIADVAERCGFNSVSYFIRTFRKIVGATPRKYREQMS